VAYVVLCIILAVGAWPFIRRPVMHSLHSQLWRRRLGYESRGQHLVRVPSGPDGRPGEEILAPSRTAYVSRFYPGHIAREDLKVLVGRRSTLGVVCLGPVEGVDDPFVQAMKMTAGLAVAGVVVAAPVLTEMAGQQACRYTLQLNSGPLLTEWQFAYGGWKYVAGIYCDPSETEEAYARGVDALATWRWIEPNGKAGGQQSG
jgi:hypothetical protein